MRNPVVKATPLRYLCTRAYLSSTRYHTRRDLSPSLFIHHPSLSSPAPRNTSDPLNAMTHTLHTLPHSSITLHPSHYLSPPHITSTISKPASSLTKEYSLKTPLSSSDSFKRTGSYALSSRALRTVSAGVGPLFLTFFTLPSASRTSSSSSITPSSEPVRMSLRSAGEKPERSIVFGAFASTGKPTVFALRFQKMILGGAYGLPHTFWPTSANRRSRRS